MEDYQAFKKNMEKLMQEADSAIALRKELKDLQVGYNSLTQKHRALQSELRAANIAIHNQRLLIGFYEANSPIKMDICPQCCGAGGFSWQNPDGSGDGQECGYCGGAGIIEKEQKAAEPAKKEETIDDNEPF